MIVEICDVQGCNNEVMHIREDKINEKFYHLCNSHEKEAAEGKQLKIKTIVTRRKYLGQS